MGREHRDAFEPGANSCRSAPESRPFVWPSRFPLLLLAVALSALLPAPGAIAGSISGGVRERTTNTPIAGATVRLEQSGQIKYTTTTNSTGNYSFSGVTNGTYNLVAIKSCYQNWGPSSRILGDLTNQNIVMEWYPRLSGGVRDNLTSNPISGATVRLEQSGQIKYATTTNATGNYSFTCITAGTYNLVALKLGEYDNWGPLAITLSISTASSQNIAMTPQATIEGVVMDKWTSAPLSGATVRLEQSGQIKYTFASTGGDGAYSITGVTAGTYNLVSLKLGTYQNWSATVTLNAGDHLTGQNIPMCPTTARISGGVRDILTNNPISGATVRLEQGGQIKYTTTSNGTGNYSFIDITPGDYNLVALKLGEYDNWSQARTLVACDNITTANIAMSPLASIAGVVMDKWTSVPLGGATVRLEQSGQIKYTFPSTGSDGVYSITGVTAGSYNLVALKLGTYQNWLSAVTLNAGDHLTGQNLPMCPATARIAGGVRNILTDDPISGATVRLEQGGQIEYTTTSNATGNYSFIDIPPGDYNLVALKLGQYDNWSQAHTLVACDNITTANIAMTPQASISGVVRGADTGAPVGGATIRLEQSGQIKYTFPSTGSDGAYSITDVSAGTYDLVALKLDTYKNWSEPRTLSPGQSLTGEDITMIPLPHLSGGIRDGCEPGSVPVGGVQVTLTGPVNATTTTHPISGVYQFNYLPNGTYHVHIDEVPGSYTVQPGDADRDVVIDNVDSDGHNARMLPYRRISGHSTSYETGLPVANDVISYGGLCGPTSGQVVTDANGFFVTPPIPQGSYSLGAGSCADVAHTCAFSNPIVLDCTDQVADFRQRGLVTITGFSATPGADGHSITITWGGGNAQTAAYRLYRSEAGDEGYSLVGQVSPPYVDGGLACGEWFYYRISPVNGCAREGMLSDLVLGANSNCMPPPYAFYPADSDSVALPQTFGWNPVAGASSYDVEVAGDAGFASAVWSVTSDLSSVPVPLTAAPTVGERYFWRVRSVGSFASNDWSEAQSFIPMSPPPPPPDQVVGVEFPSGESGEGVNTALGAVTRSFSILTLHGPGGDVPLVATYSSQSQKNGSLGPKWTWTLGQQLALVPSVQATVSLDDAQDIRFAWRDERYAPDLGVYDSLIVTGSGIELVRPSRIRLSFDPSGLVQSIRDRNGNAITLTYSGGALSQFTDAGGRPFSVTTASGKVLLIQDILGRTWRFDYDGSGYLQRFTDARGNATQFEYDGQGRLTRVVDPRGSDALRCTYGSDGRVATQTDAANGTTLFSYDDANLRTLVTNPLGGTQIHVRDSGSRLIADIDERGDSTVFVYDANHNRISVKDGRGNLTRYEYDTRGNVVRVTDPLGSETRTICDLNNSPTSRTQPLGKVTAWTNDERGNPLIVNEPLGKVTTFTYNSAGQVLTMTDANTHASSNAYDGQGNRASSTNGAGDVTTFGYDAVGRQTSATDGLGHTTTLGYDANDSLHTRANGLGETTTYDYDADGNRTAVVDPRLNRTEYTYDQKNRLTQTKDPLNGLTQFAYDALDRKIQTTDARSSITTFDYDAVGNLTRERDPLSHETTHTYDPNHNRLTTTDPRGKTTQFAYDPLNRLLSTTDPLGHAQSSTYDLLGRVVSTTDARGNQTVFVYDALDRLTSVIAPTANALQYGYDLVGNRTTVRNANGHTTTMQYDDADRLVTSTDPLGNAQTSVYDAAGHRLRRVDGRSRTTLYGYDAANRLTSTVYDDSTRILRSYDAAGNLAGMTDLWGTSNYTYDALNRIVASTDDYGQALAFGYDPNGNISVLTYPGGQVCAYAYDPLDRLTSVTYWNDHAVSYAYDPAGNNVEVGYPNGVATSQVFDDAGRLTSILTKTPAQDTLVSFAYTLDENGNRTRIVRVDKREDPQRLGGPDVYATSAALSSAAFPAGADSVILASGEAWEEAVTAPQVARQRGVPALMVPGDNLWASAASQSELARLKGIRPSLGAVVLGDIAGLSPVVEAQLESQAMPVRRVRGFNRFDTAVQAGTPAPLAVMLGGTDAVRAGAAALLAARWNAPLLLTERDSVPATIRTALSSLGVSRTILIGDETTIGAQVATWLNGNGHPVLKRYGSPDPAAISVGALEDTIIGSDRFQSFWIANKDAYQDALSAAADPSNHATPTLLCPKDALFNSPDLFRWIGRHKGRLEHTILLGPASALSSDVEAQLRTVLRTTVTEYTYSPLDELTSEIIAGVDSTYYVYDPMGNRASITHRGAQTIYSYDVADRLTAAGTTTYAYDANGNRATRTNGSNTTTYSFDFENRLTQIVGAEGTSNYRYDGLGRRIRTDEPGRTVRYVLDPIATPYRTLRETDDAGATLINYTHGAGLAAEVGPIESTRYYHYDGLGSTAAVTDSSGNDVAHLGYSAFGDTALALGGTSTPFGYVGRYGVEATASGLQFMRDRFYDSQTGKFLGQDPVAADQQAFLGVAMYLYAVGNPANQVDPSGDWPWKPLPKSVKSVVNGIKNVGAFLQNQGARKAVSYVAQRGAKDLAGYTLREAGWNGAAAAMGKRIFGGGVSAGVEIYKETRPGSGVNHDYIPLRATLVAEENVAMRGFGFVGGAVASTATDLLNKYVGFPLMDAYTDYLIRPVASDVTRVIYPFVVKHHWY
jgi:RHS repeat-associated protein